MNDQPAPVTSPQVWKFADYKGRTLTITVTFSNSTRTLSGATVVRQDGCEYRVLLWDVGDDGIPDNTTRQIPVPFGTTTISRQKLQTVGLRTIEDVYAVQFTVGL